LSKDENNPLIGVVKILTMGGLFFHDPDGYEEDLDLKWKRLCNMAQPVVDEQQQSWQWPVSGKSNQSYMS
jgi:hypothetical protein